MSATNTMTTRRVTHKPHLENKCGDNTRHTYSNTNSECFNPVILKKCYYYHTISVSSLFISIVYGVIKFTSINLMNPRHTAHDRNYIIETLFVKPCVKFVLQHFNVFCDILIDISKTYELSVRVAAFTLLLLDIDTIEEFAVSSGTSSEYNFFPNAVTKEEHVCLFDYGRSGDALYLKHYMARYTLFCQEYMRSVMVIFLETPECFMVGKCLPARYVLKARDAIQNYHFIPSDDFTHTENMIVKYADLMRRNGGVVDPTLNMTILNVTPVGSPTDSLNSADDALWDLAACLPPDY